MKVCHPEAGPILIALGSTGLLLGTTLTTLALGPPTFGLQASNGVARLTIAGQVGSTCTIQYSTNLGTAGPWRFWTNVGLPSSPITVLDPLPAGPAVRLYRGFLNRSAPFNVITTNLIWLPPGAFVMGSPLSEPERDLAETQHTVVFTKGVLMGKWLVTQEEYESVMGANPSFFTSARGFNYTNLPVEQVSWSDATNYCAKLTDRERAAGRLPPSWAYRLPTESEWEYACRAGTTTAFTYGPFLVGSMANFDGRVAYDSIRGSTNVPDGIYLGRTTTVGNYQPNGWGLYDMHGNVWEWCQDWYDNYPPSPAIDPQGSAAGMGRILRGGSWQLTQAVYCRSACRAFSEPAFGYPDYGFRVVASPVCDPPPPGIVGWWPGDGNALDRVSTNHGTLIGGVSANTAGVVGAAFTFDGTTGYVQIPDSPALKPTNVTVEAWVRFDALDTPASGSSPAGEQFLVFKQNTRSSYFEGYSLIKYRTNSLDKFVFSVSSAAGVTVEALSTTVIVPGTWYHVAGVRGPDVVQVYVDGRLESEAPVAFPLDYGATPLYFGSSGQTYWDHKFRGALDEVSIYNRALTAAEIGAIYAAGVMGKCKGGP